MRKILFALVIYAFQAHAGGVCDTAVTNADMLGCANVEFSAADKKLNVTYGKLLKALDSEGQRKLRESQRAWVKFRDINAEFSGDINRGGSAESLSIIAAKTKMTEARVKELQGELELRE